MNDPYRTPAKCKPTKEQQLLDLLKRIEWDEVSTATDNKTIWYMYATYNNTRICLERGGEHDDYGFRVTVLGQTLLRDAPGLEEIWKHGLKQEQARRESAERESKHRAFKSLGIE